MRGDSAEDRSDSGQGDLSDSVKRKPGVVSAGNLDVRNSSAEVHQSCLTVGNYRLR